MAKSSGSDDDGRRGRETKEVGREGLSRRGLPLAQLSVSVSKP